MALVYGRVELPENLELRDLITDGINQAWDDLGSRRNLGTCTHRMIGSLDGTDGYFRGEASRRALTDFGIGGPWDGQRDGHIFQWVPRGANVAPWANGPADHLEGDGVAFVQKLGIAAVNRDLKSIELSDGGNIDNPYSLAETPYQFRQHAQLVACLYDREEVPWNVFPIHPAVGIVTYLEHWEIGSKECPFPKVRAQTHASQALIRGIMKAAQTGIGTKPEPTEPTGPVTPEVPYSALLDQDFLHRQWGLPRRVYVDGHAAERRGKVITYPWNPAWVPCAAWIARARQEGEFPAPGDWESVPDRKPGDPVSMIPFANGWVLLRFDDKRGWRWAGQEGKAA